MQSYNSESVSQEIVDNIVDNVVNSIENNYNTEQYNHHKFSQKEMSVSHFNFHNILDSRFSNIVFYSMVVGLISVLPGFYYLYSN